MINSVNYFIFKALFLTLFLYLNPNPRVASADIFLLKIFDSVYRSADLANDQVPQIFRGSHAFWSQNVYLPPAPGFEVLF